ncbi:MAG: asparagine synthetase B family protein [Oligosphaeraceae bacterium]
MCAFFGFLPLSPAPGEAAVSPLSSVAPGLLQDGELSYTPDAKVSFARHGRRILLFCGEPYATEKWRREKGDAQNVSQAEEILHRWERAGQLAPVMNDLNGPFLVVCRDPDACAVHFLRDPLGQKDFFLAQGQGGVCFCDRLGLLARKFPGVDLAHSPEAVADYLSLGYIPAPRTIYANILKVPAGFRVTFAQDGSHSLHPYWRPKYSPAQGHDWVEARRSTEEFLHHALSRRLEGLDRLGFMLSGGVDSGTLLGLVRRTRPDLPCRAYTVTFSVEAYNEGELASQVAKRQGVDWKHIPASPQDFSRMADLIGVAGEPFGDSSLLACAMCMEATEGETLMTGDGGDELFGGYRRYQAMIHRHRIPRALDPFSRLLARCAVALLPSPRDNRSRLANLVRGLGAFAKQPLEAYATFQQVASPALRDALLAQPRKESFLDVWKQNLEDERLPHPVLAYNLVDLLHYLPDDGCRKQTIAALAQNASLTSPLMDREILDFIQLLPLDFRVTTKETKRLLRSIGQEFLAPAAVSMPKKGFGVPVSQWFRGPLAQQAQEMARSVAEWDSRHLLNPKTVQTVVENHVRGRQDHGALLWSLFCLKFWEEQN